MSPFESAALQEWRSVGRAIGGAVVFCLPLMMTMEMWWLSYYIPPFRLICLLALSLPLFYGVSRIIGFTGNSGVVDNIIDVLVAYAFGFIISAFCLLLFNTISFTTPVYLSLTAITLQAIPAALGALLARSALGSRKHNARNAKSISAQMIIMAVGALFLGLNVSPTEEIVLIARQMTHWHSFLLFLTTLFIMLMFSVGCSYIASEKNKTIPQVIYAYARFCGSSFLVSLFVTLFLLWVFEQFQMMAPADLLAIVVVLLFPTGIGAAAAKIII